MPRPPLRIGSWRKISSSVVETDKNGKPVRVRAKANFRDHDGQVRTRCDGHAKPRRPLSAPC
jgi:hypothetical protein